MRTTAPLVLTLAAAGALGCTSRPASDTTAQSTGQSADRAATAQLVTITARDYAFEMPDTVPAGMTEIRLVNRGTELHHVFLMRLEGDKHLSDLFAAMQAGGPPPAWAKDAGGPNTPAPGDTAATALRLEPGRYAVLCVIPSPADGKPHIMKGMSKELTVTEASYAASAAVELPSPTTTMTLVDYDFTVDKPLVAGKNVIRVVNTSGQPHEVLIAKLAPGKTPQDIVSWVFKPAGPPPAKPLGGSSPFAPGSENTVIVDLEPGDYALLCFAPDARDGKEHVAHGMLKEIKVS